MTIENPPSDTTSNNPEPQQPPKPKKRKWLRISLIAAGVIVVLLLLLLLLAPTIASTGFVRQMVLERVNGSVLNGRAEIADWSIGWSSGIHVTGIKIFDASNSEVVHIKELSSPISLLGAARGNINLGDTEISGIDFSAHRFKNGQIDLASLLKPTKNTNTEPSPLPKISGNIKISDLTGSFRDDKLGQTIQLDSSTATLGIKDINQPIDDSLDIHTHLLNSQTIGEVKIDGNVAAVQNNLVDTDHLAGSQTVEVVGLNGAAVSTLLQELNLGVDFSGMVNGKIKLDLNTLNNIAADGEFTIDQMAATGASLKGDTLRFKHIDLPVKASFVGSSQGMALKLDLPLVADQDHVNCHVDVNLQGAGLVSSQQPEDARQLIVRWAKNVTGTGIVDISADVDVASLASQIPSTLDLDKGTALTSGQFTHHTTITLGGTSAIVATETHIKNVAGANGGKPIKFDDVNANFGVTAVGGAAPDLQNLNADINSTFLTVKGTGPSFSKVTLDGTMNLANLQQQLAQFVDLGDGQFSGTGDFHVHTTGDVTDGGSFAIDAGANISNLILRVTDDMGMPQTVTEPSIVLSMTGKGARNGATTTINGLALTATMGPDAARLLNLNLSGDMSVTQIASAGGKTSTLQIKAPRIALTSCDADIAGILTEWSPILPRLIPALPSPAIGAAAVILATAPTNSPSLMQLIAQGIVTADSGKLAATFSGNYDGTTLRLDQPLNVSITDLSLQQRGAGTILREPLIRTIVNGSLTAQNNFPTGAKDLSVSVLVGNESAPTVAMDLNTDLAIQSAPAMKVYAPKYQVTKSTIDVAKAQAELGKLLAFVAPTVPGSPSLLDRISSNQLVFTSGTISAQASGMYDQNGFVLSDTSSIKIDHLSVDNKDSSGTTATIKDQSLSLTAGATGAGDFSTIQKAALTVDSTFGKISLSNAVLNLNKGPLDMLESANLKVENCDLAKLYSMQSIFQAASAATGARPAADVSAPAVPPVPPLQIPTGVANLDADISRDGQTLKANVNTFTISNLAIQRGQTAYKWAKDITAKLNLNIDIAPAADATAAAQIGKISVTSLSGDIGVATIGLTNQTPITIENLGDPKKLAIQLGLDVDGDLAQLSRVAEAFTGSPLNSFPYQGHLHYSPTMQKDADKARMQIGGSGAITQLKVMSADNQTVAFTEDELDIANPLTVNLDNKSLIIAGDKPVSIIMKSSGALTINITGTVQDWENKRNLNGVKIVAGYDLEKLWKIVFPMLSPDMQTQLKDAVVTGKFQKEFNVSGFYPAGQPFNQAIQNVNATGDVTIASLSTNGLTINTLDVPLTLAKGHLRTVLNEKPAAPATCNKGTLDLGIINIDLTGPVMLLTMENASADKPHVLLKAIQLNPTFTSTFLGKIVNCPPAEGATQAQGTMDASIYQCVNVPLSNLALQDVPDNKGVVDLHYTIKGMSIGNPIIGDIISLGGGRGDSFTDCEIDDAPVHFQNAKVTADTTLLVAKTNPIRFNGTVGLASQQFEPMTVTMPTSLLGRLIPDNYRQFVPDSIDLPLTGSMTHPQLKTDKVISKLIQDAAKKSLLNGLLGGNKNNNSQNNPSAPSNGATSQPSGADPLQQLLQGFNKPKNQN